MEKPPSHDSQPSGNWRKRIRDFWQRVTEGLELEVLWAQFKSEARASYGLYAQEVDWETIRHESRWKRPFKIVGALFMAMLMKLTPARRVLLLAAIVCLVLGDLGFRSGQAEARVNLLPFGVAGLFLLLALELADRVIMKRDLEIAREIQNWLVPDAPPVVPGADLAFATRPANTVAGDYYDAFLRPAATGSERLLVVVADVAGKSVPAALLMATFQASLRTLAAMPTSLAELVAGLNHYACAHSLGGMRFTTAFHAELEPATGVLTYVNAGHNAPVLRRGSGHLERLEAGGLPLGIETETHYDTGNARLAPGDLLVVFTDGVIEAVNEAGEEFGELRLLELVRAAPKQSAAATLRQLMDAVEDYARATRQHDDITCLVLRALEPGQEAPIPVGP